MAQKRPSSATKRTTRYTQGGTTTTYPERLGWWERRPIDQRQDDLFITINSRQDRRPDIIAYDVYQNSDLAWLVLQYNNVVDLNLELTEGTLIRLPNNQRVLLGILTNSTGGVSAKNSS